MQLSTWSPSTLLGFNPAQFTQPHWKCCTSTLNALIALAMNATTCKKGCFFIPSALLEKEVKDDNLWQTLINCLQDDFFSPNPIYTLFQRPGFKDWCRELPECFRINPWNVRGVISLTCVKFVVNPITKISHHFLHINVISKVIFNLQNLQFSLE